MMIILIDDHVNDIEKSRKNIFISNSIIAFFCNNLSTILLFFGPHLNEPFGLILIHEKYLIYRLTFLIIII